MDSSKLTAVIVAATVTLVLRPFAGPANAQKDFQEWLKKDKKAFEKYLEERDKEFSNFLKKEWQSLDLNRGVKRDVQPKPVKMPRAEAIPVKPLDRSAPLVKDIPLPEYRPRAVPQKKLDLQPDAPNADLLDIDYFGLALKVSVDPGFRQPFGDQADNNSISAYWTRMGGLKYKVLTAETEFLAQALDLNDWGFGLLLNRVASRLFPTSKNDRNLLLWFLLSKSGYDARVGYQDGQVFLLLPSMNVLYGTRYFVIQGTRYYLASFDNHPEAAKSLHTYDGRYPGATRVFSLAVKKLPNIPQRLTERPVVFRYPSEQHTVNLKFDRSIVAFFQHYPLTDLPVYFGAPVSAGAAKALLNDLKPLVVGKPETEGVNTLLRFVQTAFEYQTDQEQFGRERFLFAEETLSYPYSDCEDRSILFAYLVTNLLGLEVVGLDYPGHIATAVHFRSPVAGDFVMHKGKKYVICDPTYINAVFGMTMPAVKDATPKIMTLSPVVSVSDKM